MIAFGEGSRACWLSCLGLVGVFVFVDFRLFFLGTDYCLWKEGFGDFWNFRIVLAASC